jgi:hypothetical protein
MLEMQMRLINFMLYCVLPLWGVAGFVDWWCHRRSHIEKTSGILESAMHLLMGLQVGVPIALCLFFRVNALILALCGVCWLLHEVVAHWDVHFASPKRKISLLEVHAHNYLATIPLFLFALVLIVNWHLVNQLARGEYTDQFQLIPLASPHGGMGYVLAYYGFMLTICVVPYLEELWRCFRYHRARSNHADIVKPLSKSKEADEFENIDLVS